MALAAAKTSPRFIGQVIEHLGETALTIWALDDRCAYRAYGMSAADWPVSMVVECHLTDDGAYVDELTKVGPDKIEIYSEKLFLR